MILFLEGEHEHKRLLIRSGRAEQLCCGYWLHFTLYTDEILCMSTVRYVQSALTSETNYPST